MFFAGDTGYSQTLKTLGTFGSMDISLIPIGVMLRDGLCKTCMSIQMKLFKFIRTFKADFLLACIEELLESNR